MRTRKWLALLAGIVAIGCSASTDGGNPQPNDQADEETGTIVPPGKEDNFLSTAAREYMVEGETTVTIESYLENATEEEKLARVHELIPLKQIVIGWFLNQYIAEKEGDEPNKDYGGFSGLTKNGSYEDLDIQAVDSRTYKFKFRQEFGGKLDLLDALPTTMGEDGKRHFTLTIGKISNSEMAQLTTNHEWYRRSPWSQFDPKKVDSSRLDSVDLAVWPEPRSEDAYFDYNRLFADGKVTIAIHFGWDYHDNYHLKHSKETYEWLVNSQHFKSPVDSYDNYTRTSGPLTKTITANGKPVEVQVWLYWGKPGTDTDPDTNAGGRQLEADMRESFRTKEVIMFSGHSGPFYGFALANWRRTDEGDLDDSEIPGLDMPKDMYQVVIAEGCDTYALGMGFRLNPNKPDGKNIDVITSTSFSNASSIASVRDTLKAIIGTDHRGNQRPETFMQYLRDMESNSYWFNTMYGVHCLDDNPHTHPYAKVDNLCKPCHRDSECGGIGNACTKLNSHEKFCTFECTADDGCPEGFKCMPVATGSYIRTKRCAPINLTCEAPPPEPEGPAAILNEVFASPKPDGGDANGNGKLEYSGDEFVEIVNPTNHEVDLSGWKVADGYMVRYTFKPGTKLAAGKALLIFGGGDPASFADFGNTQVFVAPSRLGLNNSGDTVTLYDRTDQVVDQMSYGRNEGGKGYSVVREKDGDPKAKWVVSKKHHTAGKRSDGSDF